MEGYGLTVFPLTHNHLDSLHGDARNVVIQLEGAFDRQLSYGELGTAVYRAANTLGILQDTRTLGPES